MSFAAAAHWRFAVALEPSTSTANHTARWFVATKSDLGVAYTKPYVSGGYGKPHWLWAGLDVSSITTYEFTQLYAGLRAAAPVVDFALGVRDTWPFTRPLLVPKRSYARSDLLDSGARAGRYWAWEAETVAIVPLPHFAFVGSFVVVGMLDIPRNRYVYDESYRAVVADHRYMVLRGAPMLRLLNEGALKLGALGEYVFDTGRPKSVVRVGPVGALTLTDHLEALAMLTFAVHSPDRLGIVLGAYGTATLRYRWATGEMKPALPWQGEIIP
ncbi:MAG: hypothetical protein JW940_33495 [Polyangiaceae bacterium]|nr:hypothetical protein [Polyangiaceae bacterium]